MDINRKLILEEEEALFTKLGILSRGFYLTNYKEEFEPYYKEMLQHYKEGKIFEAKKIDNYLYNKGELIKGGLE